MRPNFVKKTSISNSAKSLGFLKCYSLSNPRPVKSPGNSIRHNCQKSAVDQEDLKNCAGNERKEHISLEDQQSYYLQVFQRLY